MGDLIYVVRGSLTAGAAAPKDLLSIQPATHARIRIKGITIGSQAATAAAATAWQLIAGSGAPSGLAFTPQATDLGNSRAAQSSGTSTITVNVSGTVVILEEFAFDALNTYTKWYPPGLEPTIDATATSNIFAVRKAVGTDTNIWSVTVHFAE